MKLKTHEVTLVGRDVTLRPLTENDWHLLLRWHNDPDIPYYAEGDDVVAYSLAKLQQIYWHVSQSAYCFIATVNDRPIGDCWLQAMNLERILQTYQNSTCRRIDLMIGEKSYWRRGHGTEMIRLLTRFAFERQQADVAFGCDIADYNIASLKAFQKAGYKIIGRIEQRAGRKARYCYDLMKWAKASCRGPHNK